MRDLPRRPFTELAPPPSGIAEAREAARRRRRVKAAAASTTGVGALVVVLALLGSSSLPGQDSLKVRRNPAAPGSSATSTPEPAASATPAARTDVRPSAQPTIVATSVTVGGDRGASPSATPAGPSDGDPGSYRTPDLTREYSARNPGLVGGTSLCSGTTSNDSGTEQTTVNWCHSVKTVATSRGHDLVGELCRDGSSGKQLTYDTAQEVELLVLRGDVVVWRWSVGRTFASTRHVLEVAADHCWTWTAPWTDVDSKGQPLAKGDYVLRLVNEAAEMVANPTTQWTFSI